MGAVWTSARESLFYTPIPLDMIYDFFSALNPTPITSLPLSWTKLHL